MRNLPLVPAIIILLLLSLTGCYMPQNRLIVIEDPGHVVVTEEMDMAITRYIESRVAHRNHPDRGSRSFAAQDYYGTEVKETGEINVYLWTYFQEYYRQEGELLQGEGGSWPLVVTLIIEGGDGVYIDGHHTPEMGSDYGPSIERLFPQEYHDKIFSRTNVQDLEPLVRQRAEAYFSREGGAVITDEELAFFLGDEYNLVHREELGQEILVFMEQGGYFFAGLLEDTGEERYGSSGQNGFVYLNRGGSDSVSFDGWNPTHLTYIVPTNPRVETVLVREENARLIRGKDLDFWVAFTEGPVEEQEITALDGAGNIIPLLSYEHIRVPEDEQKVDVRIQMTGRSSLGGGSSYTMHRAYTNESGVPVPFEDSFFYHGPIRILSAWEGLSIEESYESGRYRYKITGEVLPFEPLTVSLVFQGPNDYAGKSASSWYEGSNLVLFNRGENTRLKSLFISHGFPPGTTKQRSTLILSSFGGPGLEIEPAVLRATKRREGMMASSIVMSDLEIVPGVFHEFLSVSWALADKDKPLRAGGRAAGEIIDLAEQDYVYLNLHYLTRVNSLPHYLTYLALALSGVSFLGVCLLVRKKRGEGASTR